MDKVDIRRPTSTSEATERDEPSSAAGLANVFEQLAYYGLLLGLAAVAAAFALQAASTLSIPLDPTVAKAGAGAIILAALIALNWHFDSATGQRRRGVLQGVAKSWAYPMTLLAGLGLGWQWRHHNDPDPQRQQAQQIAASTCGQIAFCIMQAQRVAGGLDIGPYVKPRPAAKP